VPPLDFDPGAAASA